MRVPMLIIAAFLAATNAGAEQDPGEQIPVEPNQAIVQVNGIVCSFCAYGIEKQLQKLDGVKHVETNIKLGQVKVQMLNGKTLERIQVEEAIEKAGFSLRSFEQAGEKEAP